MPPKPTNPKYRNRIREQKKNDAKRVGEKIAKTPKQAINRQLVEWNQRDAAVDLFPPGEFSWNVVRKGRWPEGKSPGCCPRKIRFGEVVVVIPFYKFGEFEDSAIVHARCLRDIVPHLPLDRDDIAKQTLKIKAQYGLS